MSLDRCNIIRGINFLCGMLLHIATTSGKQTWNLTLLPIYLSSDIKEYLFILGNWNNLFLNTWNQQQNTIWEDHVPNNSWKAPTGCNIPMPYLFYGEKIYIFIYIHILKIQSLYCCYCLAPLMWLFNLMPAVEWLCHSPASGGNRRVLNYSWELVQIPRVFCSSHNEISISIL